MTVSVHITPDGAGMTLMECEQCGPLAPVPSEICSSYVYTHLEDVHNCNMDTATIQEVTHPHPEEP